MIETKVEQQAVAASDVARPRNVAVDVLVTQPQVRQAFDAEPLQEMADSMRQVGVLQPILVQQNAAGRFVVIDGERRLRAARLAGLRTVPVTVVDGPLDEGQVAQRQLIANVHRADLNDFEKAVALNQLMKQSGVTAAQVAKLVGLSASAASRLLAILTAPPELQLAVKQGRLHASKVCEVMKEKDPKRRESLAARVMAGDVTRDALVEARRSAAAESAVDPIASTARVTLWFDAETTATFVTRRTMSLELLIRICQGLVSPIRRALTQGMSVSTLGKAMREQANAPARSATPTPAPVTTPAT